MLRYGTMSYNGEHGLLEFHDKSKLDSLNHPRTIVTHLTYDILPSSIKRGVGKVVYVVRNPKDVFASYKYFNNALSSRYYKGNADGFLRKFLSNEFFGSGGSWFTCTKEWTDGITSNTALQVHTIMYEELKKDTYGEIEKLAKFLEIDYDDDLLRSVVTNTTFDKLKADHATAAGATDRWADMCEDGRQKVGFVGDWKNELTVSQNELFDAVIQEKFTNSTRVSPADATGHVAEYCEAPRTAGVFILLFHLEQIRFNI
ncbi:sulfotransferase 1C3-like [Mizuhopecten yessoensis]|uniref:sulfotransferase 1C3-like n=1 Tax=Mizuhopecten yessoensis TaxID=6573 RepID=UPI000B45D43A|nr:sulfotransferase 1C3-like [Mizuhopecten yessoensis]